MSVAGEFGDELNQMLSRSVAQLHHGPDRPSRILDAMVSTLNHDRPLSYWEGGREQQCCSHSFLSSNFYAVADTVFDLLPSGYPLMVRDRNTFTTWDSVCDQESRLPKSVQSRLFIEDFVCDTSL